MFVPTTVTVTGAVVAAGAATSDDDDVASGMPLTVPVMIAPPVVPLRSPTRDGEVEDNDPCPQAMASSASVVHANSRIVRLTTFMGAFLMGLSG
jgi:hypothetical protein